MGFAEAIVFVVVGWVVIYHQRSLLPKLSHHPQSSLQDPPSPRFTIWVIAVILPILGLGWVISQQVSLPLTVIMIAFGLCVWIAQSPKFIPSQDFADPEPLLSPPQEKQLKECFLSGLYQLRAIEYHRHANYQLIYCRGHLRSRNYRYVYDTINQNIHDIFGDRFICQLQAQPLEHIGTDFGDRDISLTDDPELDQALRYSFYLIPNIPPVQNPRPNLAQKLINPLINIISIVLTSWTLLMVGANQSITQLNINKIQDGLPYALGMVIIISARAIARYAIARYHHICLPYSLCFASVLPCLGGFGYLGELAPDLAKIMSPQSGIKHHNQRRILFDFAVIPSLVCLGISIAMLLLGHWLTPITNVTIQTATNSFIVPLSEFSLNNSIFAALWHSLIQAFTTSEFSENSVTVLSPLALAGCVGMSMSALQLLPLQGLDGEYLVIAMGNHHQTSTMARLTRLIILAIALFAQPWLRLYSLLLLLLPTPRPLIRNEGIELDRTRDFVGFVLIAIALLILLPVPRFLVSIS